ncbi:hypothetical protein CH262_22510 [Rhodococcus sp. 05-2255-1e]|uniref:hypothetical protein n=1 Tax=Nocardiaceae TaxID=85025 RepID=UPI00050C6FFF|nr:MULTISPECIES: hypothetical protein [Rhodococcus]OZE20372.1 hypothetical protein CH262_22510 [Rhodococcus sp. 05-2255-1e]
MTSEIDSFAVESGDPIVGIGALLVDDGSIRLTPNAPDERSATLSAVTIPVTGRNSVMPSGGWVSLSGTLLDGAIEADVIDGIDRPEYPGEPALRIPGPAGGAWTNHAVLEAVEQSESDLRNASGAYRDSDGTLVVTLEYLYLDRRAYQWLAQPHPGPINVWVALRPGDPASRHDHRKRI